MPAVGDQHNNPPPNPFQPTKALGGEYTSAEAQALQGRLGKQLGPEYISTRQGPGGRGVHYIASEKVIGLANEIFGFNGWSSSIRDIQVDFIDENQQSRKVDIGLSVIVRVTLKDGTYHEDIGYGHIENCLGKAAAFEKAKKEGTTDALKRALRNFGNVLGNCVYDKEYLSKVTKLKVKRPPFQEGNLHRHADFKTADEAASIPLQTVEQDLPVQGTKKMTESAEQLTTTFTKTDDSDFASADFDEADFSFAEFDHPDAMLLEADAPTDKHPLQAAIQAQAPNRTSVPPGNARPALGPQRQTYPQQQSGTNPPNTRPQPNAAPLAQGRNHSARPGLPANGSAPSQNRPNGQRPMPGGPSHLSGPRPGPSHISNGAQAHPARSGAPNLNQASGSGPRPTNMPAPPVVPGEQPIPAGAPVGFVPGRNAESAQAGSATVPSFNPRAESPSIRRTAGFDHTKSAVVSRTQVPWNSPGVGQAPPNQGQQQDTPVRRVGAPQTMNSPLANRGQFKPVGKRPAENPGQIGSHQAQSNPAVRQALADVTAGSNNAAKSAPDSGPPDAKRPKLDGEKNQPTTTDRVTAAQ